MKRCQSRVKSEPVQPCLPAVQLPPFVRLRLVLFLRSLAFFEQVLGLHIDSTVGVTASENNSPPYFVLRHLTGVLVASCHVRFWFFSPW